MNRFIWKPINKFDGRVFDTIARSEIFSIKKIKLTNAKLKPDGEIIIGEEVPLPLFWQQYANHENPGRHAGIIKNIIIEEDADKITFKILSANYPETIQSKYELEVSYSNNLNSYVYSVKAELEILNGKEWEITHNPANGEVEFCNFYPEGVFSKNPNKKKKYKYIVYENNNGEFIRLPLIHPEIEDYKNLPISPGGSLYYISENENPVINIIAGSENIRPGICSYMWDSHFGIRVCNNNDIILKENTQFHAHYRIYSIPREEGLKIMDKSISKDMTDALSIPVYEPGVNTFSKNIFDFENTDDIWPWQTETNISSKSEIDFRTDKENGYSDNSSLYIELKADGFARWIFTALGPDYGKQEFTLNKNYRLKTYIKFQKYSEESFARIGFRIHFKDEGNIFDLNTYKIYFSDSINKQTEEWLEYEYQIPIFDKMPDRIHLLLEINGKGNCRFDDVLFEII
jgi:hypothetical protein